MPELPKPKRLDIHNARKYIRDICGLDTWGEVNPSFFDALCNDELYFEGKLHIPAGSKVNADRVMERVPSKFWHIELMGLVSRITVFKFNGNLRFYAFMLRACILTPA